MSTRELILSTIAKVIKDNTDLGEKVIRQRVFPREPKDCPTVIVEPIDVNYVPVSIPTYDGTMTVGVMIFGKTESSVDQYSEQIIKALVGNSELDEIQGVMDISPKSMNYDFESIGTGIVWLNLIVEIKFRQNF